jgi:hypothetical protein
MFRSPTGVLQNDFAKTGELVDVDVDETERSGLLPSWSQRRIGAIRGTLHGFRNRFLFCRFFIGKRVGRRAKICNSVFNGVLQNRFEFREVAHLQGQLALDEKRSRSLLAVAFLKRANRQYAAGNIAGCDAIALRERENLLNKL